MRGTCFMSVLAIKDDLDEYDEEIAGYTKNEK